MGLIRKSLAVGTIGVGKGSSKKQSAKQREFRYATDPKYKRYIDAKAAAEAARLAKEARLRRERSQRRATAARRVITFTAAIVAVFVIAVLVWLPQLVIGAIRKKPVNKWMSAPLHRALTGGSRPRDQKRRQS
jgi:hypothetical protein